MSPLRARFDALVVLGYAAHMHPFPPQSTLEVFRGDAIIQVWLDPYGVRFLFESERQIYAEERIVQIEPDGTEWPCECEGHHGAPVVFHRLLYRQIVDVERSELRLTLRMDSGHALAIYSELGHYESGHFIWRVGDITVF